MITSHFLEMVVICHGKIYPSVLLDKCHADMFLKVVSCTVKQAPENLLLFVAHRKYK